MSLTWSELAFQKCINKITCMTKHQLRSESCLKQSHPLSKLSVIHHHAKSSSFFLQLGLQIKNFGWGRGRWQQLQDCQWVHGSSLVKRSSKAAQWQAENVSKTKDDGLLHAKVSWIGSNTSGVVFRAKKPGYVLRFKPKAADSCHINRVTMLTKAVRTTACDWSVSDVKTTRFVFNRACS